MTNTRNIFLTILSLLMSLTTLASNVINIENSKNVEPIIVHLQNGYASLNRGNLQNFVTEWTNLVEESFCENEQEDQCDISYEFIKTDSSIKDYKLRVIHQGTALPKNSPLNLSLGMIKSSKIITEHLVQMLWFDQFQNPTSFSSYLEIRNLDHLINGNTFKANAIKSFVRDIILPNIENSKTEIQSVNYNSFQGNSGGILAGYIKNKNLIGKALSSETDGNFQQQSPFVFFSNGVAYQANKEEDFFNDILDSNQKSLASLVLLSDMSEIKTLHFPFEIKNELNGLYHIAEYQEKDSNVRYLLNEVGTGFHFQKTYAVRGKKTHLHLNRRKKMPNGGLDHEVAFHPHVNSFDLGQLSLTELSRKITTTVTREQIKKLLPHSISDINKEYSYLKNSVFPNLNTIEFNYFIASNYQEISNFYKHASNKASELEKDNILLLTKMSHRLNSYSSNSKETSFYQAPAEGIPFQAVRLIRQYPEDYELTAVLEFDGNTVGLSENITFSDIRLVCKSQNDKSKNYHHTKAIFDFKNFDNTKKIFKATFDLKHLDACDTFDEQNFTFSVDLFTRKNSGLKLKSIDWFIKRLR